MNFFKSTRLIVIGSLLILLVLIIAISFSALAGSNAVPSSRLDLVDHAKLIAEYRPPACAGLTLVNFVFCTTTSRCRGTNQGDLILGNSLNNDIRGVNGADCIIAGGGNDDVGGGNGSDICVEGPGTDDYNNCIVVNP